MQTDFHFFDSYDDYVKQYRDARVYKLYPGDIFTIDSKSWKSLRMEKDKRFIILEPKLVWFKPKTWFPKIYKIMYIGEM